MNQLSIFDIPLQSAPETIVVQSDTIAHPENEFDFSCEIPASPNITEILQVGDRVIIWEAKYSQKARTPGIVKGFVSNEVLVRRKDGEGLYLRRELHKVEQESRV